MKNFTITYYVKYIQVQKARIRYWLEWVAPNSAITTSVIGMTYTTPPSLARAGQGIIFVYSSSYSNWVCLAQLKHHLTTLKHWSWLLVQYFLDQRLLPWAVPFLLFYFSGLVPSSTIHFSHLPSGPTNHWPTDWSTQCNRGRGLARLKEGN